MKRTLARTSLGSLLLVGTMIAGCDFDLPRKSAGQYCQRDDQCIEGLVCLSRQCTDPPIVGEPRPLTDSGTMDAGTDAGPVDAGTDAGPEDAGTDAGPADAGTDAGPEDAGTDAA